MVQFGKGANFYFLIISVLQCINEISITAGVPTNLPFLFIIVLISMIKDAYEDYARHKRDEEDNTKKALVFDQDANDFVPKDWRNVAVGSILKIRRNEGFPADLILINSSEKKGSCYIETKNLDGETNLKLRHTNREVLKARNENELGKFEGGIDSEKPNANLHKYEGSMKIKSGSGGEHSLTADNIVLRGCNLRNTESVEGIVVFTGHDTKLMQNSAKPAYKFSKLEKYANLCIVCILSLQMILAIIGACISASLTAGRETSLSWVE
jgi:phospholipid-transporting ATPase